MISSKKSPQLSPSSREQQNEDYHYILSPTKFQLAFTFILPFQSFPMTLFLLLTILSLTHGLILTLSDYYDPYGMSLKLLGESNLVCLAAIDSRIAHFDNPLEWFQSSLQQQPCIESRWVIVVASPSALDPSVIDILQNHASVDVIASDIDPRIPNIVHIPPNTTVEISPTGIINLLTGTVVVGAKSSPFPPKTVSVKPLSKTSSFNILWAILISCLSGLIINFSAHAANLPKRTLYSTIPS